MSVVRRSLMNAEMSGGGELPDGYTRLQYIYNTSDAYIDTGVAVGNTDKIVFAYLSVGASNTDNKAIWGAYQSSSMHCWVNDYKGGDQIYFRWGGKSSSNYEYDKYTARLISIENNVFTWKKPSGQVMTWNSNAGTFQMNLTITLFARNNGNALGNICQNRGITKFEIVGKWNGIPCINDNNVVGMYDTVSQTLFSSPNGTAFIAGPNYE